MYINLMIERKQVKAKMDLLVTPRHEPEYPDETGSNNFLEDSNSRKSTKIPLNKTGKASSPWLRLCNE